MSEDKKVEGYQRMLEGLLELRDWKKLREHLDEAVEKAVILEELTREEAEHLSDYVQRDVEDAAKFMVETGEDLARWLRFDIKLLEERLWSIFERMADHTREGLDKLAAQADIATHWKSGEITGVGSLVCEKCGQIIAFQKPAAIPVCPQCQHDKFSRVWEENNHKATRLQS